MVVGGWLQGGARNGVAYIDCLERKKLDTKTGPRI